MPVTSIDLSIIIISYNTKQITLNCLETIYQSLKNTALTFEILLVDNASKDGSQEIFKNLASKHRNLRLILNQKNLGFARANNYAVESAYGTHLLFLNSDVEVLNNAIEKMFSFYKQTPHAHFVGAKLLNKDMTPQYSAAPFYTLPVVFGALFLRGDYWGLTRSSPNKTQKVDWVSGACIMTKKEYFVQVGGFDEGIFMYMDEVDLLYRARQIEMRSYFYHDAHFIHLGSASSKGKTYPILQVYQGLLYFYKKHYSYPALISLRIMLQLKALISIIIGYIINNNYLKRTYEEAYKMV
ncbi:MAG: glycosyltransferase family 2 protein [Patescibacteria group bacterium]